jgi:hypothetical protein
MRHCQPNLAISLYELGNLAMSVRAMSVFGHLCVSLIWTSGQETLKDNNSPRGPFSVGNLAMSVIAEPSS